MDFTLQGLKTTVFLVCLRSTGTNTLGDTTVLCKEFISTCLGLTSGNQSTRKSDVYPTFWYLYNVQFSLCGLWSVEIIVQGLVLRAKGVGCGASGFLVFGVRDFMGVV